MRSYATFALAASLLAACVTVEPPPDPRGAVKPGQRMIVMVHQSPGPWIIADSDSKAEKALKILPLGTFLMGMQEDRINELSKEIQQYLPRPRYDRAVEAAMITAVKAAHGGTVQTASEAGITPGQRRDWNAAADQLEWRRNYYFTDQGRPSPRDYSKILSLDDAVIVEVNLSFGLEPDEQDRTLPLLSAASRLYRADTARMLWSREDRLSDTTSSSTLTEFRANPPDLTDRLYALSVPLANRIAMNLAKDARLISAPTAIMIDSAPAAGVFYNGAPSLASTSPASVIPAPTIAVPAPEVPISTGPTVWATPPPLAWPAPEPVKPPSSFPTH